MKDTYKANLSDANSENTAPPRKTDNTPADAWYHYSDESYNEEEYTGEYSLYEDYKDPDTQEDSEPIPMEEVEEESVKSDQKAKGKKKAKKKEKKGFKVFLNFLLAFLTVLSIIYLTVLYCPYPAIRDLRNMYIEMGMNTLNHKHLVTAIIPSNIIDEVMLSKYHSQTAAIGVQSDWGSVTVQELPTFANDFVTSEEAEALKAAAEQERLEAEKEEFESPFASIVETDDSLGPDYESYEEATFFGMFHELDYDSFMDYVDAHPSVLDNGWENIYINEGGLDDEGTTIETTMGEQVLVIDAKNGILIVRVYLNNSRALYAVLKDASRVSLKPASTLGSVGLTVGEICEENDAIFGINGSAFADDGSGNGGQIAGLAICDGQFYGSRLYGAYKRIELRDDGKMYVVDSAALVYSDTLHAAEFLPALIIDGQVMVDDNCGWTGFEPRTVIGQSNKLEIQIVICEGRYLDSPGTSVVDIAELLYKHGCVQALNLDGGTSAMMYYKGEYLNRCSNPELPEGRGVPTAWVYK